MKCCAGELDGVSLMIARKFRLKTCGAIVQWCGVRWYGIPSPLRVLAMCVAWAANLKRDGWRARRPHLDALANCGCIVVLKDAWLRLRPIPVFEEPKRV